MRCLCCVDVCVSILVMQEEQYTRQVSLTLNTDLVMRDCIFRHYLEVLDASAGGRLVLLENFMVGGLDDVFFVHNSRAVQSSAIYSEAGGRVAFFIRIFQRTLLATWWVPDAILRAHTVCTPTLCSTCRQAAE